MFVSCARSIFYEDDFGEAAGLGIEVAPLHDIFRRYYEEKVVMNLQNSVLSSSLRFTG